MVRSKIADRLCGRAWLAAIVFAGACGGDDAGKSAQSKDDAGSAIADAGRGASHVDAGRSDLPAPDGGTKHSDGGVQTVSFSKTDCSDHGPAPCASKVLDGDVRVASAADLAQLEGVTEITGFLTVGGVSDLSALACLETVGDVFDLDLSDTASVAPLRNLKSVDGDLTINAGSASVSVDCGFQALTSLGATSFTGGAFELQGALAGKLSLSSLKTVRHIRISGSALTDIALPNHESLVMGQLFFDGNRALANITGFEGVTIQQSNIHLDGVTTVSITDNPMLSECRAEELRDLFVAAGYSQADMKLSGNMGTCSK
ncbi:MAG: hypothetical protein JWN04_3151 [Myxococcaceae bacterium]|nr:hypothetical protein [Myxococcaceae bacterium]